jgi:hypothetical protein
MSKLLLFALFAFSGLFIPPTVSYAHYDPKGLPPIRVEVELISLQIDDDWDDGMDGDAEIVMGTLLLHGERASHGKQHDVTEWSDWDTEKGGDRSKWINKIIHRHIQCNPKSPVSIGFKVMESDQFNEEQTGLAIGSGLAALAVTLSNPVNSASALVGLIVSGVAQLNKDDLVGVGGTIISDSGYQFVDITSDAGKKTGQVYVAVKRTILNEGHEAYEYCKTKAPPDPPVQPSIAPFLEEAKKAILSFKGPMGGEKGTEDDKTSERDARDESFKILLEDLKETYDETEKLIDENAVAGRQENVTNSTIRMIELAEKYERDGQLDDSAETYLKILEMLNGQISPHDEPLRVVSDIEELTRETSELLDKQMEKREQAQKDKKQKNADKKEDKQVLSGLFSAAKWLEYANKMVSDALKQSKDKSQESKDNLKHTTDLAKEIKQLNNDIKKAAKESKVSQNDLNKAAKEPIDKLKAKKRTTPEDKIKEAQKATESIKVSLSESAKWIGEILESDTINDGLKGLPGIDPDLLTVKSKEGFFEGDVCEGYATVTAEWELVTPQGTNPQESVAIEIDIYDDGKKISTEKYILADNTAPKIYNEGGRGKIASYDKSMNPDFFYTKYQVKFDPKKGKTIEFKLSNKQRLLPEKYTLVENQFPITVKIPKCKIDSVIDDLQPAGPLTDQDLPVHDKKSGIDSKSQDKTKQPDTKKKPIKKTDKDKAKSTKDATTKAKISTVEYDSQTLNGLYTAIKWAEYSQNLLIDAINQYNKELKTQIKQDEQEYASTKNKSIMDAVIENKDVIKKNDIDLKNLINLEGKLKDYESEIRKEAAKKKIPAADLNKAAEDPINKIEILPLGSINDKFKEVRKVDKQLEEAIKELREHVAKNLSPITQSTVIRDIEWFYDGTACDDAITITVKWFPNYEHPLAQTGIFSVEVTDDGVVSLKSGKHSGDSITFEYKTAIDPKKGKTVKIDLKASARDSMSKSGSMSVMSPVIVTIPPCPIDSVVADLQPIVVIDQDGGSRKDEPKLVGEIIKTTNSLKEIQEKVKKRIDESEKIQGKPSTLTTPPTQQQIPSSAPQTPSTSPAQTPTQPTHKTIKLADRNHSAVQHSADPCLTTHTIYYQFAYTTGGYPTSDKVTITESGPRGNLVHQGILDGQGKYQIIIQNPPMQPGFEFRLTNYESSSGSKLETPLPDIWQFNVGPCVYPGTPGYPSSQPPSEQQSGSGTGQLYFVQMYTISGKNYPIYQFVSSAPDSCNDYHFHASSGKAYAIDGSILNDPAPSGCGYGKTNSMGFTSAAVYKSQIISWEALTGINIPEDD